MNVLDLIVEKTREELERRREAIPLASLQELVAQRSEPRLFHETLASPGISLIAEHKRRSPASGLLRAHSDVAEFVQAVERGGATALSIFTEPSFYEGSLDDLRQAHLASSLPILRKDFIIDRYQLFESAAAGADAIVLIAAALDPTELDELYREARSIDLDVLVEVHNEDELAVALEIDIDIVAINNRDLTDFSIDTDRTFEMLTDIPAGKTVVSESGFSTREEIEGLDRVGVDAVLIGEALMRSEDIEVTCMELIGASAAEYEH